MFKKFSLIALFAMMCFCAQSQEDSKENKPSKFGFTAGYINSEFNKRVSNYAPDERFDPIPGLAGSGMFMGLTFDAEFNKNFSLSSEFLWVNTNEDQFRLAGLLKYNLFDTGFHILAGPELNYSLSGDYEYNGNDYGNELGLNLTGGLEYDINSRMSVYGKYSHELTNRYNGGIYEDQYKGKFHDFRLGLKFRF